MNEGSEISNSAATAYTAYVNNMEALGIDVSNTCTSNSVTSGLAQIDDSSNCTATSYTITTTSGSTGITIPSNTISSGSGLTWTTTTTPNWATISNGTGKIDSKDPDLDLLEDLKEEFEAKLEEAVKSADDLVKQMKDHPESAQIMTGAFNFFTGQRTAFTDIIKKLEVYIKDYSEDMEDN